MNINVQRKPAPTPGVPSSYEDVNCGSGFDFGICPRCKRGHGYIIFHQPAAKTQAEESDPRQPVSIRGSSSPLLKSSTDH